MDTLGLDEDMPIENKLIPNTIESAQKKLEASNFAIRTPVSYTHLRRAGRRCALTALLYRAP